MERSSSLRGIWSLFETILEKFTIENFGNHWCVVVIDTPRNKEW